MKTLVESCREKLSAADSDLVDTILWLKGKSDEMSNYTGDWFDAFVKQAKKESGDQKERRKQLEKICCGYCRNWVTSAEYSDKPEQHKEDCPVREIMEVRLAEERGEFRKEESDGDYMDEDLVMRACHNCDHQQMCYFYKSIVRAQSQTEGMIRQFTELLKDIGTYCSRWEHE